MMKSAVTNVHPIPSLGPGVSSSTSTTTSTTRWKPPTSPLGQDSVSSPIDSLLDTETATTASYPQYASSEEVETLGLLCHVPRRLSDVDRKEETTSSEREEKETTLICRQLIRKGYDLRLGEVGRTLLKREISKRMKNAPEIRQKCLSSVCRLKNANVHQLLEIAEMCGCLHLALLICNTHWRDSKRKSLGAADFSRGSNPGKRRRSQRPSASSEKRTLGSRRARRSTPRWEGGGGELSEDHLKVNGDNSNDREEREEEENEREASGAPYMIQSPMKKTRKMRPIQNDGSTLMSDPPTSFENISLSAGMISSANDFEVEQEEGTASQPPCISPFYAGAAVYLPPHFPSFMTAMGHSEGADYPRGARRWGISVGRPTSSPTSSSSPLHGEAEGSTRWWSEQKGCREEDDSPPSPSTKDELHPPFSLIPSSAYDDENLNSSTAAGSFTLSGYEETASYAPSMTWWPEEQMWRSVMAYNQQSTHHPIDGHGCYKGIRWYVTPPVRSLDVPPQLHSEQELITPTAWGQDLPLTSTWQPDWHS